MADLIFVAVIVAFFTVAVGLVRICERIVGGAGVTAIDVGEAAESEVAA
jgi:hypothetical protein